MLVALSITHVVPSHARPHLGLPSILPTAFHISDSAAVTVFGLGGDLGLLLETQRGQSLAAALVEGLRFLGCVDARQAHFHLLIWVRGVFRRAAGGEGIAIADSDDETEDLRGERH